MLLTDVRPLSDSLPYGVRIGGVTRELLQDAAVREEIDQLFIQHGMIVFEGVEESDEMQIALSDCFGPLKEHPVASVREASSERLPGVIELRTAPFSGGIIEVDGKQRSHWLPWHFDHCYNDELNRAGVLRSVERVDVGGITGFLDGVALYNAFPKELLAKLEGLDLLYILATDFNDLKFGRPEQYRVIEPKPSTKVIREQAASMSRAIHPAVWTLPSGEKSLHVSLYMLQGIVGNETSEGDALLEEVCQTINRVALQCSYHHKWGPGEMVIWDNTRMLHCVSGNRPEDSRLMYRTTIKGDYGLGRWENASENKQPASA